MGLLLVEDDEVLRDGLTRTLQKMGFQVEGTAFGRDALEKLTLKSYEVMILDLGLPDMFGLDVLKQARSMGHDMPVLILTALDAPADRVNGLNAGADDYLGKPFDLSELEARLRALLRRLSNVAVASNVLTFGELRFESSQMLAYVGDVLLDLSTREACLLQALLRRPSQVVSKEQLVEQLSDEEQVLGVNAIEVYMHRLRKKLEASDINIRTVRGLGYLLELRRDV